MWGRFKRRKNFMKKTILKIELTIVIICFFFSTLLIPNLMGEMENFNYNIHIKMVNNNCFPYIEVNISGTDAWINYIDPEGKEKHVKTIQEAVSLICENGFIYIKSENYILGTESIIIDKSMKIIGEDKKKTVISAYATSPYAFLVKSDSVSIENLTIKDANYPNEPSSTQAGIFITNYDDNDEEIITIKNNIIKNNDNGIFIQSSTENLSSINISSNEIYNSDMNGITFGSGSVTIWNNTIHHNNESGISIWTKQKSLIVENNIFSNKRYGIWIDEGSNNTIAFNTINNTKIYDGICFWSKNHQYTCDYNYAYNNTIENNSRCGIFLGYALHNVIFDNNIIKNSVSGIHINYPYYPSHPMTTENKIFYNNFIGNGFHRAFGSKYCNADDSGEENAKNHWDNGPVEDKIYNNDNSMNGGNYWSDYESEDNISGSDYYNLWEKPYGLISLKIIFFVQLENLINHEIEDVYLYSPDFDFLYKTFDRYPWCRQYGWNPMPPEQPDLFVGKEGTEKERERNITCRTTDKNNDKIFYEFKIFKIRNNQTTVFKDWTKINEESVISGLPVCYIYGFTDTDVGWYNITVRAYDCRDNRSINNGLGNRLGFDGVSKINYQEIKI